MAMRLTEKSKSEKWEWQREAQNSNATLPDYNNLNSVATITFHRSLAFRIQRTYTRGNQATPASKPTPMQWLTQTTTPKTFLIF